MRRGESQVWRISNQRLAIRTENLALTAFAAPGDSGGPVFYKNQFIGILNTVEESCETLYGEDYGIINSVTYFSAPGTAGEIKSLIAELDNSH